MVIDLTMQLHPLLMSLVGLLGVSAAAIAISPLTPITFTPTKKAVAAPAHAGAC